MNTETMQAPPTVSARLLACLSVAIFWLLPFSPLVAIAALKSTRDSTGWPRTMATAGAWLSVAAVMGMSMGLLWIVYIVLWNPALA